MAFDCFELVPARPAPVAVHHEGDVLWDWPLFQRADDQLAEVLERILGGWDREEPAAEGGGVVAGHGP